MGVYLNPNNNRFRQSRTSKIYVDKSSLLTYTNSKIDDDWRYVCVSRPRRFGKSMAANMVAAYYCCGCDSHSLFDGLEISKNPDYEKYLNKYAVIQLDMNDFFELDRSVAEMISIIEKRLRAELMREYSDVDFIDDGDLIAMLTEISTSKHLEFIFVIDEWDCIFRFSRPESEGIKYLEFIRKLLKNKGYVALAYMTGILPIKKYKGDDSAVNMFDELSIIDAGDTATCTGFTDSEVRALCSQYNKSYDTIKMWYDGYSVNGMSIYNPTSVSAAMNLPYPKRIWDGTGTFESLSIYIETNIHGVRAAIQKMLGGNSVHVDISTFKNDLINLNSKDDVLTALVHLGYLTYDKGNVRIPNYEIKKLFISTLKASKNRSFMRIVRKSEQVYKATVAGDSDKVAELLESIHQQILPNLKYNNEDSLYNVISYAYMTTDGIYTQIREMPSGKGYADLVLYPENDQASVPAIIIELKYNKSAEGAIAQIKNNQYVDTLKNFKGNIILAGINYDEKTRKHTCIIERIMRQ